MPSPATLPLASLAEYPSLGDSLVFQLNGLIVVFMALCSIWLLLEISGLVFRRRAIVAPAVDRIAFQAPVDAAAGAPVSGATVAAIFAAVHVTLNSRRLRISAITPAPTAADWAREGRREIFSSHRMR